MWPNPQFPADLVTYTEEIHNGKLHFSCSFILYPPSIYLFKVNNENTRAVCKICSKLTIKTPERRHWRRSGAFFNFVRILHTVLVLHTFWYFHCQLWTEKCRLGTNTSDKPELEKLRQSCTKFHYLGRFASQSSHIDQVNRVIVQTGNALQTTNLYIKRNLPFGRHSKKIRLKIWRVRYRMLYYLPEWRVFW